MKFVNMFPDLIAAIKRKETLEMLQKIDVIKVDENCVPLEPINDPAKTVLVGDCVGEKEVFILLKNTGARHFVQLSRADHAYELLASAMMLIRPESFFGGDSPFILYPFSSSKFERGELHNKTFSFSSSREKYDILLLIKQYIKNYPKVKRYSDKLLLIADELISNAVFNAPTSKKGERIFHDLDRTEAVAYPEEFGKAQLSIYHDKVSLILACTDPWGTLNQEHLIENLSSLYSSSNGMSPKIGTGGSGLGCAMVIDNSLGLYFLTHKQVETRVCACFDLGVSYKMFAQTPKHVHFCERDDDAA